MNADGDEEGVGNWIMDFEKSFRVEHRIACPELGYSESEALYPNIEAWEKAHNRDWYGYVGEWA